MPNQHADTMQFVDEGNLPSSDDLAIDEPPSVEDSSAYSNRSISLGAAASVVFHGIVILAFVVLVSRDHISGAISSFPSFAITLTTSLDVDGKADQEAAVATSGSPGVEDESPTETVEETPTKPEVETAPSEHEPPPEAGEPVKAARESAPMQAATSERLEPAPEAPASETYTPDTITTSGRSIFAVNTIEPVNDVVPAQNLTDSQTETFEQQIKEWRDELFEQVEEVDQMTWEENGQVYLATFEKVSAQGATDFDYVDIAVTTQMDGKTLETSMQMRRMAFSDFGQIIDRWDRDVFLFNDQIEGRFHSNSTIQIDSNRTTKPIFHGQVTTSRFASLGSRASRKEIFLGGLETRAKRVELPRDVVPFDPVSHDIHEDQLHFIEGDADIVFHGSGEYSVTQGDSSQQPVRRIISSNAHYIIGSDRSMLSVEGVVKGCVVVYSPDVVSITGDLRYAQDPRMFPESADYLGLISARYVEVASPDVTGPGDLTIHGAIYAKRRFSVKRYRSRNRGLLTIYGSLAAGSLSATEPRYATRISYDHRFQGVRPPGYPLTEQYELAQWDRVWREVN
jgi:hypothetical protein